MPQAGPQGIEPCQTGLESVVQPLHQKPVMVIWVRRLTTPPAAITQRLRNCRLQLRLDPF